MNGFTRLDGPFYKYGTLITDLAILSILWALCSLPIITLGASTTALYYVTTRQVSNREGYITRDFFKSFKQNFVKSTFAFLLLAIPALLLGANFYLLNYIAKPNQLVLVFQVVLLAEIAGMAIYMFPLIARFDLKFGQYFKNAFYFANRHISTTVTCIVFMAGALFIFIKCAMVIIILPGVYAYFASKLIMRVFRKYLPDMDRDTDEGYNQRAENDKLYGLGAVQWTESAEEMSEKEVEENKN